MKPSKTPTLPTSPEASPLVKAVTPSEAVTVSHPLTARFKGLVQTAKGKWSALGKGEAEALAPSTWRGGQPGGRAPGCRCC